MAADHRAIGYCTNVHAGATWERIRANLETHALAVKAAVSPRDALGIGLWLSAAAARDLRAHDAVAELAAWLADSGLDVFTINGFPYGDFHRDVVKHDVYRPDWREGARLEYTIDLARILAALRPEGGEGSISTLPLGWGPWLASRDDARRAAANLLRAAETLAAIEADTGRLIHLDLEPEPGCVLQRGADVASFFADFLLGGDADDLARRHLRVCHDICHAAVMFDDQAQTLARYDALGVAIGKVQVSAAVRARFDDLTDSERRAGLAELAAGYGEPRYLHQTVVRHADGSTRFHEDLPEAVAQVEAGLPAGEWRVHFHVPIFLERFGRLDTTRNEIDTCIALLRGRDEVRHWEVETYTWDVLPQGMKRTLAGDIARELRWLESRLASERVA